MMGEHGDRLDRKTDGGEALWEAETRGQPCGRRTWERMETAGQVGGHRERQTSGGRSPRPPVPATCLPASSGMEGQRELLRHSSGWTTRLPSLLPASTST